MKYEKISAEHMNSLLDPMLSEGEESLCPIYCVFRLSSGFGDINSSVFGGYVTCTSGGRLLLAVFEADIFKECSAKAFDISGLKNLKIKKKLFGEYRISAEFPLGNRSKEIEISVLPKVHGGRFPDQAGNSEKIIEILRKSEIERVK